MLAQVGYQYDVHKTKPPVHTLGINTPDFSAKVFSVTLDEVPCAPVSMKARTYFPTPQNDSCGLLGICAGVRYIA